jgi:hypothetical protein
LPGWKYRHVAVYTVFGEIDLICLQRAKGFLFSTVTGHTSGREQSGIVYLLAMYIVATGTIHFN